MQDCCTFLFQRLPSLKALLRKQDNVEGLVIRNIRNFLYDTQKKHDPLGFRLFVMLAAAVERALKAERIYLMEGGKRVGNRAILGFTPGSESGQATGVDLSEHARKWNDDLLPELVTARGKQRDKVAEKLAQHLPELKDQVIEAFGFKDLLDSLKWDARARLAVMWEQQEGEAVKTPKGERAEEDGDADAPSRVWLVPPNPGFEERQFFEKLLTCVDNALDRLGGSEKTRDYRWKLWFFLRNRAVDNPTTKWGARLPDCEPPSRRKIAEFLGIPRHRLTDLFASLGRLVNECRQTCRAIHSRQQDNRP